MNRTHVLVVASLIFALSTWSCADPEGGGGPPEETSGSARVTVDPRARAIEASDIEKHMRTLSADSFAGRAPGTPGGRMAAEYIAARFQEAGLEPVDGNWFQAVPMVGSTPIPETAELSFEAGSEEITADYPESFVIWSGSAEAQEARVAAEMVFVGYGIVAPENDWNDYEGVDVAGKVVLILVNDPPAPADEPDLFGGRAMTYYGRWTYKYEEAARHGALGAFIIHTTEEAGYGWNVVSGSWTGEQFALPADPDAPPPVPVQGWVAHDLADRVLAAAGHDLESLREAAASRDFRARETGVEVHAGVASRVRTVETRNVWGLLPGSEDPGEVITLTSHYDHLGVGQPVDGDSIYNGAYDNASGTALLMELAEAFTALEDRPERSLLFVATAAEEQGLLGTAWYTQNPPYPLARHVAEINMDGANLWGETDDVVVMGAERSELGKFVEPHARDLGMRLAPDPEPEKGFFFRSDHFPFARAGVPSLYFEHGRDYRGRPEGWGQEIQDEYSATAYHAPADEFREDFVFDGAVQQGQIIFLTALDLANSEEWPNWEEGSEFRAARDEMMASGGIPPEGR